jgi:hypothetical protein
MMMMMSITRGGDGSCPVQEVYLEVYISLCVYVRAVI